MIIDAHQHFWTIARGDYGWLTEELGPIFRDFGPVDLAPMLEKHNIGGTVLVQAAPTVAETRFMLDLADNNDFIKGVVGWVDFEADDAAAQIADLATAKKLVGLRPMIQDIPDPEWMLQDTLTPAFEALIAADLTFDALTLPPHLAVLDKLISRHPDMRVVVDHGSKPEIAVGKIDDWARDMSQIASHGHVYCKLSGLLTEAGDKKDIEDLRPYMEHILSAYGPDKVIWGSDWPVLTLAEDYDTWFAMARKVTEHLDTDAQQAVFGGNAVKAYKLAL